jgi:hypothetical protein
MLYVQHLNLESKSKELYERQLKERRDYLHVTKPEDAVATPEPNETKAPDGTDGITLNNHTPQNISTPTPQITPTPQNITTPSSQKISPPPILDPPSQISSTLPLLASLPPTVPRTDQEQGEQRTGADLNVNRLTMDQALELFELLQARRAREADTPSAIVAHPVEVAPRGTEPLSFLTLQTVEGIVGSTEFCTPQGQSSWESKMEKFVGLGHTYSSVNTVTGENCYMLWSMRRCTRTFFLLWQQGNKMNRC